MENGQKIKNMSYKPRKRQEEAIDKMIKFVNNKTIKKGIFVYPTSFGKSIVIANVASKFPDKYFINVTSSKELVKQNYDKFTSYGYSAELCSASLGSKEVGKITFATIGTLISQVDFFKDKEVIILADECHTGSKKGSQLHKFLEKVKKSKLIGTTATPLRLKQGMNGTELKMMNRDRDCFYSSIEDVVQISEVVSDNYWSKLIYDVKDVDESSLQLNGSGTDYTDESLKKFNEDNNIVKRVSDEITTLINEGRKSILVFVPFISEATQLEADIEVCRAVYSGMDSKERDLVVSGFKSLKIKVVSQVNILSIGFDHPELDAIIFARPTNSITLWYQGLGRGVRIHKNKRDCKVVDLSGNFHKFGKIEEINFEDDKAYGGWAAFSGDRLLTNYPLGMETVPTKESLRDRYKKEKDFKDEKEIKPDPVFFFGKFKDKKVSEVAKEKEGRQYMAWIVEPKTKFNFFGEKGQILKIAIYNELSLPIPLNNTPTVKTEKVYYKTSEVYTTEEKYVVKANVENYTDKIKTIYDLKDVF